MEVTVYGEFPRRVFSAKSDCFYKPGLEVPSKRSGGGAADNVEEDDDATEFDRSLRSGWQRVKEAGGILYQVDKEVETRSLAGKEVTYVVQYNPMRAAFKRKAGHVTDVVQDFDPESFNFTKADLVKELVFELRVDDDDEVEDVVMVNNSPVEKYHCLLIPDIRGNLAQVVTERSIELAARSVMLSGSRSFKAGFNSLCGHASVNHLHWHLYYLRRPFELPVETVPGVHLGCGAHRLRYSAGGFGFEIRALADLKWVVKKVAATCTLLAGKNVAHNLFITRGRDFQSSESSVTRILVFPRTSVPGQKLLSKVTVATCELAGHIVVYDKDFYGSLTAKDVQDLHRDAVGDRFDSVLPDVMDVLKPLQDLEDSTRRDPSTVSHIDLESSDEDSDRDNGHNGVEDEDRSVASYFQQIRQNQEMLLQASNDDDNDCVVLSD